jgi:hypothetical protein
MGCDSDKEDGLVENEDEASKKQRGPHFRKSVTTDLTISGRNTNNAHVIEAEDDDQRANGNNVLDILPKEILNVILTSFLDGKSLSTGLLAFLGTKSKRDMVWQCFQTALSTRVRIVCGSPYMPVLHKNLWEELPPHADQLAIVASNDRNQQYKGRIRQYSEICIILSFFEPSILHKRLSNISLEGEDDPCGVEFPIWSGSLKSKADNFDPNTHSTSKRNSTNAPARVEESSIVMSMPHSSWCILYMSTWGKFRSLPCIAPTVRRAIPLPPVLRIHGAQQEDELTLRRFATLLEARDEVGCVRHGITSLQQAGGYLSSLIFMSRKQALRRWEAQSFISKPRHATWPLDVETTEGEDELFGFLVARDYNKEQDPVTIELLVDSLLAFLIGLDP